MAQRPTDSLKIGLFLFILLSSETTGSSENDLYLDFCGTWLHGEDFLSLNVNLSTGCDELLISANKSSLSIRGQITAYCTRHDVIPLNRLRSDSNGSIDFCLYWEPLLDQLKLQIGKTNFVLCWPTSLQDSCCTDLSNGPNKQIASYGIKNGMVKKDIISDNTMTAYSFEGQPTNCKELCDQASQMSNPDRKYVETQHIERHCAHKTEVEMKENFSGSKVTSHAIPGEPSESTTTVYLPLALKEAAKNTSKVVCTFFRNNSLFQEGHNYKVLNDVVGITVENEVISNLSEPIRIGFHHDDIPKMYTRKCVSWDTRKDPLQVNWLMDGCKTKRRGTKQTECQCDHLTYFSVLVQLEPRPVRHLLALTVITSLGCAVSAISCVGLIIFLCRKRTRSKEQSIPIHLGLAVSLAFLALLFFFTGVLANVGGESVCTWVGAMLHYALLSSFAWMGIQVFHTFWLVFMIFTPSPKAYVWTLVGFVLPGVPVGILAAVGDIYGVREVVASDDVSNPYRMCWIKENKKAFLAHCFTTMTVLAILVLSGFVMLFLVYRKIRTRDEWSQNRVAFFSIWGLSCLFGTTWGLTFLDFEPLSDCILFLFCILNSFQGFFLMLRFYMLDRMRKQAGGSGFGSTSTGSTRQHMLQAQEKS
ncbi:adhesion G-protein coupled receptor G1 [Mugil cephalus]|uniref:adhesion G-protein coupled receptor G1 n=1 Tax=Mugil cephalus TaxID=48193 RepID=UPI001FB619F3|nr:adhesion G-protein coupled receptor G1 [Mugil cephalus]XP_047437445.1 adhesion G-protein coupled receptor G1 [Mugil cephalus]